ncbi:hypothetical protein CB0940_11881 [Lecanosticta acicola]|uniref:CST complex subunit Ten1 n=1 Tax=Lecanosticta acicola TaxID=111012 RepID=A0AAI8W0G2_9PEZI|nr:hypothetical protein CB0940_11881 [Lecanosticta acicola]
MASTDERQMKPEPMRLVLLEQLPLQSPGTKIRFLGCVHEYQGKNATLVLKESCPASTGTPKVLVNITNVLESVNHELLQVGAWLNIVGYVTKAAKTVKSSSSKRVRSTRQKPPVVDALMLWSAGAIKLQEYKASARSYQDTALQTG